MSGGGNFPSEREESLGFLKNFGGDAMSLKVCFTLREFRFLSGPEALTLTDPVRTYISRLEVVCPFCCVSEFPFSSEEGSAHVDRIRKEWSDVPYYPSEQLVFGSDDDEIRGQCFRSGDQLCVLMDDPFSTLAVVPSWWVHWCENFICCRDPFVAEGEAYGPDDPIFSVYGVWEFARKRNMSPRGFIVKYMKYLFGGHCLALPILSKRRGK